MRIFCSIIFKTKNEKSGNLGVYNFPSDKKRKKTLPKSDKKRKKYK